MPTALTAPPCLPPHVMPQCWICVSVHRNGHMCYTPRPLNEPRQPVVGASPLLCAPQGIFSTSGGSGTPVSPLGKRCARPGAGCCGLTDFAPVSQRRAKAQADAMPPVCIGALAGVAAPLALPCKGCPKMQRNSPFSSATPLPQPTHGQTSNACMI